MRDFNHSVSVLVQAYLNDTLEHGDCTACVVGNLIKASGYKLEKDYRDTETYWLRYIEYKHRGWFGQYDFRIALEQIASTGYTSAELDVIERAFEKAPIGNSEDDWMFNGLMAVVDVLAEIHGIDLKQKEEAKALFVR